MDAYSTSSLRQWMTEEEDDDTLFLPDDDEAKVTTHTLLAESVSSSRRRRSDAPPKVIRPRDLPSGHRRIKADYFAANPVYNDKQFRRRFRMQRHLFKRIKQAVKNHDNYFKKKLDACCKEGLSALQKDVAVPYNNNPDREAFVAAQHRLRDPDKHYQLQSDLIEHHWMRRGAQQQ